MITSLVMAPAAGLVAGGALALPHPELDKAAMIDRSIEILAWYYAMPIEKIMSNRRWNVVVGVRQRAAYLAFLLSGASLTEMGPHFGGRDWMSMRYSVL
ncbi:MAG: helix-turn-helix domain-containing protein, partial [Hyphomicrobiaceae bacterium]